MAIFNSYVKLPEGSWMANKRNWNWGHFGAWQSSDTWMNLVITSCLASYTAGWGPQGSVQLPYKWLYNSSR